MRFKLDEPKAMLAAAVITGLFAVVAAIVAVRISRPPTQSSASEAGTVPTTSVQFTTTPRRPGFQPTSEPPTPTVTATQNPSPTSTPLELGVTQNGTFGIGQYKEFVVRASSPKVLRALVTPIGSLVPKLELLDAAGNLISMRSAGDLDRGVELQWAPELGVNYLIRVSGAKYVPRAARGSGGSSGGSFQIIVSEVQP